MVSEFDLARLDRGHVHRARIQEASDTACLQWDGAFLSLRQPSEVQGRHHNRDQGRRLGLGHSDDGLDQDELDGFLHRIDSKIKCTVKISAGPFLNLKSGWQQRVTETRSIGGNHFMSSTNFHRFLNMLLRLVARPSETSARTWVDAFLYRASAMLPDDKRMTLNVEYSVLPVTVPTASGVDVVPVDSTDYTVVVAAPIDTGYFLNNPSMSHLVRYVDSVLGFFVVKAISGALTLFDCLPQVLPQLHAAATQLRKTHVRGALTNGYEWLFVILTVNSSGGASYSFSNPSLSVSPHAIGDRVVLNEDQADMIAGILASWIQRSSDDIGDDDWFEVEAVEINT